MSNEVDMPVRQAGKYLFVIPLCCNIEDKEQIMRHNILWFL